MRLFSIGMRLYRIDMRLLIQYSHFYYIFSSAYGNFHVKPISNVSKKLDVFAFIHLRNKCNKFQCMQIVFFSFLFLKFVWAGKILFEKKNVFGTKRVSLERKTPFGIKRVYLKFKDFDRNENSFV